MSADYLYLQRQKNAIVCTLNTASLIIDSGHVRHALVRVHSPDARTREPFSGVSSEYSAS